MKSLCIILSIMCFSACAPSSNEKPKTDDYFEGYDNGYLDGYWDGISYTRENDMRELEARLKEELEYYQYDHPYDIEDMKRCYEDGFLEGVHTLILYLEEDYGMNYERLCDKYYDAELNPWMNFDP